jgi:hypothetical protein
VKRTPPTVRILFFLAAASISFGTSLFLNQDVCTTVNCTSFAASFSGTNAGTGESDLSGVIDKGTPDPSDTFDQYGFLCTGPGITCATSFNSLSVNYGNTNLLSIARQTDEFFSSGYYRFLDTFTNNTATPVSGDILIYGNLAWITEGQTADQPFATDPSQLNVFVDSGNDRPAIGLVSGNNPWSDANIIFSLDGRSPAYIVQLNVAPGQSVSLLSFVVLAGTPVDNSPAPTTYDPDSPGALALALSLMSTPDLEGLTSDQIDSIVNFTPEPGTLGLVGVCLIAGGLTLRRRKRNT